MNPQAEKENDALYDMLRRVAIQLGEHFNSVQVLATKVEPSGGTTLFRMGVGDWYARRGAAQEFIEKERAETFAAELKKGDE